MKEFDKFLKNKFSLSSHAKDIVDILDIEPDVSRFYAELVPISISPEEFWARYFFRVILMDRTDEVNLDDDEDEDLEWDSSDKTSADTNIATGSTTSGRVVTDGVDPQEILLAENKKLKGQLKALVERISALENELHAKDELIASLRGVTVVAAEQLASVDESQTLAIEPSTETAPEAIVLATESVVSSSSSRNNYTSQGSPTATQGASDDGSVVLVNGQDGFSSSTSLSELDVPPAGRKLPPNEAKRVIASLDEDSEDEETGWT